VFELQEGAHSTHI